MSEIIERTLVGSVVSISGDKSRVALIQRSVKPVSYTHLTLPTKA